jgi:sugar lactone lactonase YvrE
MTCLIRKITPAGVVTTVGGVKPTTSPMSGCGAADGKASLARFNRPTGIAVDPSGNVYVADTGNYAVRRIWSDGTTVDTWAGTLGQSGTLTGPEAIAIDQSGNVFVTDNDRIMRIASAGRIVTTLAGSPGMSGFADGIGSAARFEELRGLGVDSSGTVYAADFGVVRKITPNAQVTTLAGAAPGASGSPPAFNPDGMVVDKTGNLYVCEGHGIKRVTSDGAVTAFAGGLSDGYPVDGIGTAAVFDYPHGLAMDGAGNLYVAEYGNRLIRKITPAAVVTTIAGGGTSLQDGPALSVSLDSISGIAYDPLSGNIYVSGYINHTIRKLTPGGQVITVAGEADVPGIYDGPGADARFNQPDGLAVDRLGNLYVADSQNHTIRKIDPSGQVSTFAGGAGQKGGADGVGSAARFDNPRGLTIDSEGNLYVGDTNGGTIRQITPAGVVTTVVGVFGQPGNVLGPLPAHILSPVVLAIDETRGDLLIAGGGAILVADLR